MLFPEFIQEEDLRFICTSQVEEFLKDEAQVFAMFASFKFETKAVMIDLSVVWEFPYVFPGDIIDLPTKREVKFSIDLVPNTNPMSMAPYMMSTSELGELRKQIEDVLENKFVRPSVSL